MAGNSRAGSSPARHQQIQGLFFDRRLFGPGLTCGIVNAQQQETKAEFAFASSGLVVSGEGNFRKARSKIQSPTRSDGTMISRSGAIGSARGLRNPNDVPVVQVRKPLRSAVLRAVWDVA